MAKVEDTKGKKKLQHGKFCGRKGKKRKGKGIVLGECRRREGLVGKK